MAIPLAFRNREVMKRLDPFVARGMRAEANGPVVNGLFPRITKKEAKSDGRADARPITFTGNKVVVIERWHPAVPAKALGVFSPWVHADTLIGIELASAPAYYGQFDVPGGADVHKGLEQFQQSCQFCHGARGVGAKLGWDFVEPTAMYSYRPKPRTPVLSRRLQTFRRPRARPDDAGDAPHDRGGRRGSVALAEGRRHRDHACLLAEVSSQRLVDVHVDVSRVTCHVHVNVIVA